MKEIPEIAALRPFLTQVSWVELEPLAREQRISVMLDMGGAMPFESR